MTFPYTYPLMSVRECNSDQTACSVGVVKLHSDTVLQDVSDTGATVLVSVTYDLGRSQVIGDTVMTTREEIPSDVPALKGASHFEKTVTIPLGEMRHLTFDHGVEFGICVAAADQYTLPANGACAMDDILTGKPPKTPISSL
ncbi:hypothetical protein ACN9MB_07375 [Dyella kyungheensis]|uniref:hypothetical protein n=1 Tax=Dyella kyungheensis TaxID=1242174 RepID=UPI003CF78C82